MDILCDSQLAFDFCLLTFRVLFIPLLQHQPPRPILPVLLGLLVLQHAERFAWEVVAVNVFGVEDVAYSSRVRP